MNDPKTTNDIRMIAVDVTTQQAEVCAARRENLEDKIKANATAAAANVLSITKLTAAMAEQTTKFTSSIAVLNVRLALSAAVGGSLPVIVVLAWQYFTK